VRDEALFVPPNVWVPDEYRKLFVNAGLTTSATPGLHQWFVRVEPHVNVLARVAVYRMAWRQDWSWLVRSVREAYGKPGVREEVGAALALGGLQAAFDVAGSFMAQYTVEAELAFRGRYVWEDASQKIRGA
jgi:hypothetical protein